MFVLEAKVTEPKLTLTACVLLPSCRLVPLNATATTNTTKDLCVCIHKQHKNTASKRTLDGRSSEISPHSGDFGCAPNADIVGGWLLHHDAGDGILRCAAQGNTVQQQAAVALLCVCQKRRRVRTKTHTNTNVDVPLGWRHR